MDQPADTISDMVAQLRARLPRMHDRDAGRMIAALRRRAMGEGMLPVADLADGLAAAMMRDRRGTPMMAWIEAIGEAATLAPADRARNEAWLASIAVRLAH